MKKIYLLLICLSATIAANAQIVTLYTPNGSPIETFISDEYTNERINQITNQYRADYGAENVLAPASRKYNCHSYAWHISEGGTQKVWMNQYDALNKPNIWKYWTDGSYVKTTESEAEKIFYYKGDHSAIKSKTVAGKYESKWGSAPLMRHSPTQGPAIYDMDYRKYYKRVRPFISGLTTICDQATYTIENLPSGATVEWSSSDPYTATVNQDGTLIKNQNASLQSSLDITLTAKIFLQGITNPIILNKLVVAGIPNFEIKPITDCMTNENSEFGKYYMAIPQNSKAFENIPAKYEWMPYVFPIHTITAYSCKYGVFIKSEAPRFGIRLKVTVEGLDCHSSASFYEQDAAECYNSNFSVFSLSPNPATSLVTLQLDEEETSAKNATMMGMSETDNVKSTYQIQLWNTIGLVKTLTSDQPTVQIPLDGLPKGFYYVHVIKDGNIYRKQLIIE